MRRSLSIAGTVLTLDAPDSRWHFPSPPSFAGFLRAAAPRPDLMVEVRRCAAPAEAAASRGPFTCEERGGELHLRFFLPGRGLARWLALPAAPLAWPSPHRLSLFLNREIYGEEYFYPLDYPLDEMLLSLYWAGRQRAVAHALGVERGGRGYLFLGHSGAGKSTQARLLAALPDLAVLSDDRVVLERKGGAFGLYGTPWHGELHHALNRRAPLARVFVMQQGKEWRMTRLSPAAAAAEVISRLFLIHFHRPALQQGIELAAALVAAHDVVRLEVPRGMSVEPALE